MSHIMISYKSLRVVLIQKVSVANLVGWKIVPIPTFVLKIVPQAPKIRISAISFIASSRFVSLTSLPLVKQMFWKTDGHGTYLFTGSKFISPMLEFLFERFIQWFQFFSFGLNQKSSLFILNLLQLTKLQIYYHCILGKWIFDAFLYAAYIYICI